MSTLHLVDDIRFGHDRFSTCTACELVISGKNDAEMAQAWSDHVQAATGKRPVYTAKPLDPDTSLRERAKVRKQRPRRKAPGGFVKVGGV